ncbi:MAG: TlpA family protein disulfide reductase [Acidimicrobiales bacterium]|nr:TlpA family protein disulfide reductase [Acidimicrobiales bacterium]
MSNKPNRKPSHANRIAEAAEERKRRTGLIIGVLVVAVVVALLVALLARRSEEVTTAGGDGGGSGNPGTVVEGNIPYGGVNVQGAPLPEYKGEPDDAVGMTAPTLNGSRFDEQPITIPAQGKGAIIMFLAHWCPHCQAEVPRLQEYINANGLPQDVNLFAVATGTSNQRPNFPPGKWLNREGWTVPTMVDNEQGEAAQAYGLSGFPFFVVVDAQGKVVQRASGELEISQFEQLLEAAKSGNEVTTGSEGPSSPNPG